MTIATSHLIVAGAAALLAASLTRNIPAIRASLAFAGAIGLAIALRRHQWLWTLVAGLLLAVNLARLAAPARSWRPVRLNEEERAMATRALPRMRPRAVRWLLDQGLWIDGRAGEVLIREGAPALHLFYLAMGEAEVSIAGHRVATCPAGHFLGEMNVVSGGPSMATVTLVTPARFWCIAQDALGRFLAANPEVRPALESAFVSEMAEKLRLANRRAMEGV